MKAVLVTTIHRGVFFGYIKNDKKCPDEITLTGVKNCIYWPSSSKGFLGLALTGPNTKDYKIGARVTEITLYGITSVTSVEDSAVKAWEAA